MMNDTSQSQVYTPIARLALWLGFVLCLAIFWLGPSSAESQAQTGSPEDKLSYRLKLLSQPVMVAQDAQTQANILGLPVSGPGSLLTDETGRLLVYIRLTRLSPAHLEALANAGASVLHVAPAYRTVTAYLRPDRLRAVAAVPAVEVIVEELTPQTSGFDAGRQSSSHTAPVRPQAQAGCGPATTSEGDIQLNAVAARSTFGLDGSGTTVGVLSDSFDNPAISVATNSATDIASGDLPGPGNPCGRLTPVTILQEGQPGQDEGRAMLQIVHDLAPGANLAFSSAFFGQFNFADQIRALQSTAGADVMVDDIFYFADPFFQDGPITQGIDDATANGAVYFTLAGNHHEVVDGNAVGSYEAPAFRPTTCPVDLDLPGDCHDFDPTAGVDNRSSFTLDAGGRLDIDFQWAEPWFGVETNLDIYLVDSANKVLRSSLNNNDVTQIPFEFFSYTNPAGSPKTVFLVINRAGGTANPRLKHILLQTTRGLLSVEHNGSNGEDIVGPTVYGHSGAGQAISVAAVRYNTDDEPESFSSRGFPTYYLGPVVDESPAQPLATPETRQKPDISATNGGQNTFFGSFAEASYRFFGTSAAGPHAAAVGALMTQRANQVSLSLDHSQAETILESTSVEIVFGSPESSGAGLVDALAAVGEVAGIEPTPEPTSSPITFLINGPAEVAPAEMFDLSVEAEGITGAGLYGVQFEIAFNPELVSVGNLQVNPAFDFVAVEAVDNTAGKLTVAASRQGSVPGLTGNVSLLTLEATAADVTDLVLFSFENVKVGDNQALAFDTITETYAVSIEDASTPTPTTPTPTPDLPTPEPPTPTPDEPTTTPTPTPDLPTTPQPGTSAVFGQVILAGRAFDDWSGAVVSVDDTAQSDVTDASGSFTISGVAAGPHSSLTADAPGYLPAICPSPDIEAPETNLATVTLLGGDVNDDAVIDVADATTTGISFGQTGPDLPADINRDGIVNILDIILVNVNFGRMTQTWDCLAE